MYNTHPNHVNRFAFAPLQRYYAWGERRQRKTQAIKTLADDMDYLKSEVEALNGGKIQTKVKAVPPPVPAPVHPPIAEEPEDDELEVEIAELPAKETV